MLLLIDSMNIIKRVYGGAKYTNGISEDELTSRTISGSVGSIRRALREHAPSHALAAFEGGRKGWRNEIYPEYKKEREEDPPALVEATKEIQRIMEEEIGLQHISKEGYEAEDLIASMARKACQHKITSIVLSTDKDFASLLAYCSEFIKLYDHFDKTFRDEAWVMKKFLVKPEHVVDSLSLWGDPTDGVPGIPGIGVKKASDLINEFGSLEDILANAEKVKGKIGEKLITYADMARISYELVRLDRDIDIGVNYKNLAIRTDSL